ncbi:hypothetical protein [Aquiflexum gelatinilyticum]|uniref:DUF2306 domain-containing protein n=1 Tax=Aquiflexum gelatinilyticum TaxID=2961943 RepID=A0A9X2SZB0_9BACT|nr:hypothetical protein [Aquiflexum gelatinilyticum]MCR9016219.1 hypothetical protein [Aquiflexum gelatinilyticum]
MKQYLEIFTLSHVFFGSIALLSGVLAIIFKKGGKGHNSAGKIYYWSMIGIGITAFGIAIPKGNLFLLMVGGFSTYMTLTGYRFLQFRRNPKLKFGFWDYIFIGVGFLTVLIPSGYIIQLDWKNTGGILIVFFVFSAILISMLTTDLFHAKKHSTYPKGWFLNRHISRMMGAFIATVTAFLVQNWQTDQIVIAWLLPTVIFVPLIIYFTKKFKVTSKQLKPQMPTQNS